MLKINYVWWFVWSMHWAPRSPEQDQRHWQFWTRISDNRCPTCWEAKIPLALESWLLGMWSSECYCSITERTARCYWWFLAVLVCCWFQPLACKNLHGLASWMVCAAKWKPMDEPRKFDDVISSASNFDNFSSVFICFPMFFNHFGQGFDG